MSIFAPSLSEVTAGSRGFERLKDSMLEPGPSGVSVLPWANSPRTGVVKGFSRDAFAEDCPPELCERREPSAVCSLSADIFPENVGLQLERSASYVSLDPLGSLKGSYRDRGKLSA